uniref:(northern house mosquito) hypothetical protein n=1 Tax=Culex pipiens TaxID=7175 RepID=A0A8D8D660_CULPI
MKRRPTPSAVASENNPDREEKGDEALGLGSSSAPYGVTTKASSGFEHLFHQRVALEFVENPKDDSVEVLMVSRGNLEWLRKRPVYAPDHGGRGHHPSEYLGRLQGERPVRRKRAQVQSAHHTASAAMPAVTRPTVTAEVVPVATRTKTIVVATVMG